MKKGKGIVFSICVSTIFSSHEVRVLNRARDNVTELLSKSWKPDEKKEMTWTLSDKKLCRIKKIIDSSAIDTISVLEDIEPVCYRDTTDLRFCGKKKEASFRENNLFRYKGNLDNYPNAQELIETTERILGLLNEEFGINISIGWEQ